MAYLNIDIDFLDHPKTKRLTGLLGRGSEVLLIRLWSCCGKFHCETGRLDGYSAQEVESLAGWWGKPGDMLQAMLKVGWMECDEQGTWSVHDWSEHQGHLQMFKERGRMMAEKRWNRPKNTCSNAASITSSNAPTVPTVPTNQSTCTSPPPRAIEPEDSSELPTKTQAVAQATMQAVDPEFAGYVFDDWHSREGRDSSNTPVSWIRYVVKRWGRERKEWVDGTHRGRQVLKIDPATNQGAKRRAPETNQRAEEIKVKML